MLRFENRLIQELPGDPDRRNVPRQVPGVCWSAVQPTPVPGPRLLATSTEMLQALGMTVGDDFAEVFGGNRLWPGMQPWAARYGGHQFGGWAGQLGDGRAISLGEALAPDGRCWELQLKGAGPTPYSRRGDGRAVLRSSLREFLCSEAMHHLGIPTTRALSLVLTGEGVMRDMFYDGNPQVEPGAICCRVSPSFLRFGNYEIHAAHKELPLLEKLIDFTLDRDFPELQGDRQAWFGEVCRRTARLMVEWMRVGFVHGVMNTDNLSILGLTIDYGPYGWLEPYDPHWTPNTTDAQGRRYRFGNQPQVAHWNLAQLAEALAAVMDPEGLGASLDGYVQTYNEASDRMNANKFGFPQLGPEELKLIQEAYSLLAHWEGDMTLCFRALSEGGTGHFYSGPEPEEWRDWVRRYQARLAQIGESQEVVGARMRAANPHFVLRNYLCQLAIERAEKGDVSAIEELLEAARRPYDTFAAEDPRVQPRPEWARVKPGCSMLSCSS